MCGCRRKIGKAMARKSGINIEEVATMVGGASASAAVVNGVIFKNLPEKWKTAAIKKWGPAAAKIIIGVFARRQKNKMIKTAGLGSIIFGGIEVAQSFLPKIFKIEGIGYTPYDEVLELAGGNVNGLPAGYGVVDDMEERHMVSGRWSGDDHVSAVSGLTI